MNSNLNKKLYLPLCERENWKLVILLIVILNGVPFIAKYVMNTYFSGVLDNKFLFYIQVGMFLLTLLLVVPICISNYFHHRNRSKRIKFMKNSIKVKGNILCVEKIVNNSHSSRDEIDKFNICVNQDKEKYGRFGAKLGRKVRYRVKVQFLNNYNGQYDIVYSDWYDDYKCFASNIDKFDKFFFLNENILNEHYRNNLELVDVFYTDKGVVVGDFYKK